MEAVYRMAAFVAMAMTETETRKDAQAWLVGVHKDPTAWLREANAFDVLLAQGFSPVQAGRAINAALEAE